MNDVLIVFPFYCWLFYSFLYFVIQICIDGLGNGRVLVYVRCGAARNGTFCSLVPNTILTFVSEECAEAIGGNYLKESLLMLIEQA